MISMVWRWEYNISGERYIGTIPFKMFWLGALILFAGLCTLMIIRKVKKNETIQSRMACVYGDKEARRDSSI